MRKGFLAALALVLGHTSAQAQYYPAQRPVYYPTPNQGMVWVVPQAPAYYPNPAPRAAYPAAGANYLPQNYFPAPTMQAGPPPAPATPVPAEPVRTEAAPANGAVAGKTVSRPVTSSGPAQYFASIPASAAVTHAPLEPVVFHRDCNERFWVGGSYLAGWINQGPLGVPLVTTGSVNDTNPGALGEKGTVVLFGDRKLDFRMLQGLRLDIGHFFDNDNRFSADISGFYFLPRHVTFNRGSDDSGLPILSRPVFNVAKNQENIYTISSLGTDNTDPLNPQDIIVVGKTSIDARTQLLGAEINGRWHSYCGRQLHTQALVGFRTLRLEETLRIQDTVSPLTGNAEIDFNGTPISPGDVIIDRDGFRTENQFYGFQVGGKLRWEMERAFLDVTGKVAMGMTDQRARIEGSTTLISPGLTQTAVGGILAVPSNIGEHNRQVFGVVPEVGINLGADITRHLRATAGYSFMVWSGVTRPGLLIDRSVNPVQVPTDQDFGTAQAGGRPAFRWREEALFLQSFSFGLEFHY